MNWSNVILCGLPIIERSKERGLSPLKHSTSRRWEEVIDLSACAEAERTDRQLRTLNSYDSRGEEWEVSVRSSSHYP